MRIRGKKFLKAIGVAYLIALMLLLFSWRYGRARRTRPMLIRTEITVPQKGQFSGWRAEKRFEDTKRAIVGARYRIRLPVLGFQIGQPVTAEVLEKLIEANPGAVWVWDPREILVFAARKERSGEELGDEFGNIIARVGEVLDEEKLFAMAVAYDAKTGPDRHEKIWVRGTGSIVGLDLTLVFAGLNFLALVALLYAFLWEPVTRLLDERAAAVRADVEAARVSRDGAEVLKERYDGELVGLKREAERLKESGRRSGEEEKRRLIEDGRKEATRLVERTRTQLEEEAKATKEAALAEIGGTAARVASRILQREVRPEDHKKLTEELLRELEKEGAE